MELDDKKMPEPAGDQVNPDQPAEGQIQPDVAQPDVVQPDVVQPDVAQPDLAQPDVAQPDVVQPDVAQQPVRTEERPAPTSPFQSPPQPLYPPPVAPPQTAYQQSQAKAEPDRAPRRRSLVGPLILVFVGLALLLNNLGLITWSIWEILWRFWPVWLIALGADMLLGRRGRWGWLAVLAILLTLFGGIFYYVGIWTRTPITWESSEARAINQALDGAREARVEISAGVSRFTLRSNSEAGFLVQGQVTPVPGERIQEDYRTSGDTGYYTLNSQFQGVNFPFIDGDRSGSWNLSLTDQIPIALTVESGVGKSELDLSNLNLTDLKVTAGVGETSMILPAQGQLRGRIDAGVGQIVIRVPESMAVRVRMETGIGGVSVRGEFEQNGDYYTTPGYDQAENRIDLTVEGGVGGIRLESMR